MVKIEQVEALTFHHRITIPENYRDVFGHMNVQYYLGIFSDSVFVLMEQIGINHSYIERGYGFFAGENRLRYLREVQVGDTVACYSRLLERSDYRLHFMQFMVNETRRELSTTFEALAFHVDTNTRRPTPFPEHIALSLDTRLTGDQQLDWPAPVSDMIKV